MSERTDQDFVGVVVAAGNSTRFPGDVPKQFRDLGGRSVLERSVAALAGHPDVAGVVVVLHPDHATGARGEQVRGWPGVLDVVAGGERRSDSVRRGLEAVGSARHVLVHDAARPLVPAGVVDAVIDATRRHGAAIPVVPVPDTVKRLGADGRVTATIDRDALRLAQTPQGARADWLLAALAQSAASAAPTTDEAAVLELAGHRVAVVDGDSRNRKITTAADLEAARQLVAGPAGGLRVGTGFDVHRLGADRPLVLGGVRFQGEPGLVGHSDADVVLHAAMDAVLGAAALGDIGEHFPPEDARFLDADSTGLATEVAGLLTRKGYAIVNLDLTLLCERPRIRERRAEMRAAVAASFRIPVASVGLKATTLEKLGALGRGEGIACEAVALVRRAADDA